MKKIFLILSFFVFSAGFTQTIKGGWIQCEFGADNVGDKTSAYLITAHIYGLGNNGVIFNFFDAVNGKRILNLSDDPNFPYGRVDSNRFSYCPNTASLNNKYVISYKPLNLVLPTNPNGYLVTINLVPLSPTGFAGRESGIKNIYEPGGTGILLSTNILGTVNGIDYHKNTNPIFDFKDTVSVCRNTYFSFPYIITDPNGDSLSYSFGDAIQAAFDTTSPPLFPVQYNAPYSGAEPMGSSVTINPVTGVISGTAPDAAGGYNITVYVQEWRNGILITTTRKESQIKVVSCPFAAPLLKPVYSSCRFNTFTFKNELTCPGITSWFWDFGLPGFTTDTSSLAMPTFTYPTGPGTYTLKLKVANNDGYTDSATAVVRIVDSITVSLNKDTAVCKTDSITLRPVTEGTSYLWRESGGGTTLNNYIVKNPKASPVRDTTVYFLRAQLNNCRDSAAITVYASPYPKANAGADTIICAGNSATLNGTISGAYYTWTPTTSLTNSNSLHPVTTPQKTTTYVLSARDTLYCPKSVTDTVIVKVVPKFRVDAGNDEYVVLSQPYQMKAIAIGNTEIVKYEWEPSIYLSNLFVRNPFATVNAFTIASIPFRVKATTIVGNCAAMDEVVLKVFKTGPDILLPTAFTPNNDGKNDLLKPILIGIGALDYFTVYNRYGQTVFSTSERDKGWDGTIKGVQQNSGVYVVVSKGKDYLGKGILKKGTVVLIR